ALRTLLARSRASDRRPPPRPRSAASGSRGGFRLRDLLPCFVEDLADRSGDLVELLLGGDQRWRDLDDRIAAVVRPADHAFLEEPRRDELPQQGLAFGVWK